MIPDWLKSIGAGFAGMLTGALLSIATDSVLESTGFFPPATNPELYTAGLLAIALFYRAIYTVASGYVTAALAPNTKMRHAIILGGIGTIITALGAVANWDKVGPNAWYPIALTLITIPCVWLGAKLEEKRTKK